MSSWCPWEFSKLLALTMNSLFIALTPCLPIDGCLSRWQSLSSVSAEAELELQGGAVDALKAHTPESWAQSGLCADSMEIRVFHPSSL